MIVTTTKIKEGYSPRKGKNGKEELKSSIEKEVQLTSILVRPVQGGNPGVD